jgi:hypothetical protein
MLQKKILLKILVKVSLCKIKSNFKKYSRLKGIIGFKSLGEFTHSFFGLCLFHYIFQY